MTSALKIIVDAIRGDGLDPMPLLSFIKNNFQTGGCEIVQIGNSVFLLIYLTKEEIILHLFSKANPIRLRSSIQEFQNRIKKSSIQKIYGYDENPKLMHLLNIMQFNLMKSDKAGFSWMLVTQELHI